MTILTHQTFLWGLRAKSIISYLLDFFLCCTQIGQSRTVLRRPRVTSQNLWCTRRIWTHSEQSVLWQSISGTGINRHCDLKHLLEIVHLTTSQDDISLCYWVLVVGAIFSLFLSCIDLKLNLHAAFCIDKASCRIWSKFNRYFQLV